MTNPVSPVPLGFPENQLIWCTRCHVHHAHAHQPLCPVCKDKQQRGER